MAVSSPLRVPNAFPSAPATSDRATSSDHAPEVLAKIACTLTRLQRLPLKIREVQTGQDAVMHRSDLTSVMSFINRARRNRVVVRLRTQDAQRLTLSFSMTTGQVDSFIASKSIQDEVLAMLPSFDPGLHAV